MQANWYVLSGHFVVDDVVVVVVVGGLRLHIGASCDLRQSCGDDDGDDEGDVDVCVCRPCRELVVRPMLSLPGAGRIECEGRRC